MPRKKVKIVSLEVTEPNSTWDYRSNKLLNNFVCKQEDTEKALFDMDRKECWRKEKKYADEVKAVLAAPGTRNARNSFFTDSISMEEIKLPTSVKGDTKYIYKFYDYSGENLTTDYGTQKDIISHISKRIKTKYAYVNYNGQEEKIEYSPKTVANILSGLEETTSQFEIEPFGRSGSTEDSIIVAIFKNCLK